MKTFVFQEEHAPHHLDFVSFSYSAIHSSLSCSKNPGGRVENQGNELVSKREGSEDEASGRGMDD
jgi:hypothetical protein